MVREVYPQVADKDRRGKSMTHWTSAGVIALLGMFALPVAQAAPSAAMLEFDPQSPPVMFAVDDIESALQSRKHEVTRRGNRPPREMPFKGGVLVRFETLNVPGGHEDPDMKPEGYKILVVRDGRHSLFTIYSTDAAGAMYGGLELAEQIRTLGVAGVTDTTRNPYMPMRGTKFNAPLDLRTPSYSDMSDSAQKNIATMWDFGFWRAYLDQLARDRYNFVALWNLHPFPSMVKVPDYPDVALDDVWRTTAPLAEDYSTRTIDLVTPAMLAQHEVVRRLTIAEKMDFWRRVMAHAKDRNIGFYVVTWNIYTYGVDGKYGITDAIDNPKTVDYFRASVREMFRAYPLLAGIGLTAGENMGDVKMYSGGVDAFDAKENWLFATYGQGVLDAARAEPNRRFRLIHRQHESRAQDIANTFAPAHRAAECRFQFQLQVRAGACAFLHDADLPSRLSRAARGPEDVLDHPQRRRAAAALGRTRLRARVREEHPVREIAGLLLRLGHVGMGTRVPASHGAAAPRDRQALAALHVVGPAGLRPHARRRTHRRAASPSALPASMAESCSRRGRTLR